MCDFLEHPVRVQSSLLLTFFFFTNACCRLLLQELGVLAEFQPGAQHMPMCLNCSHTGLQRKTSTCKRKTQQKLCPR